MKPFTQAVPFSGDMNRGAPSNDKNFEAAKANLYSGNFITPGGSQNLYSQATAASPSRGGLPHLKDPNQMNERERRIFLRDQERARRNQQPTAGIGAQLTSNEGAYGGNNQ